MVDAAFLVVIPCFRDVATVGRAVASVLAQDTPAWRLVVVDDGSADGSGSTAEEAFGGDARCSVLRIPNGGPSAARNAGAAVARDEPLIAFLDADDRWHPGRLSDASAQFAANPGLGAGFCRIRFLEAASGTVGRVSAHVPRVTLVDALAENAACTCSALVTRAEAFRDVGGFDATLRHAEDQDFLVRMLAGTLWEAGGTDAVLVDYATSGGGLSSDLGAMERGWQAMAGRVRDQAGDASFRKARAVFLRYLARRALRLGLKPSVPAGYMARALASSPAALLTRQPRRTAATVAGILVSAVPGLRGSRILKR